MVIIFSKKIKNKLLARTLDWVCAVIIAILLFALINNLVFSLPMVFGNSMDPTLKHQDRVLLSPLPYYFFRPKAGDIIAFPSEKGGKTEYLTKRIVAVPGDTVDFDYEASCITVNGEKIFDEYSQSYSYNAGTITYPVNIPDGYYFVMGDNKAASLDSRYTEIGLVSRSIIEGKIILIVYPFSSFGRPLDSR